MTKFGFITRDGDVVVSDSLERAQELKDRLGVGSDIISKDSCKDLMVYLEATIKKDTVC